MLEATFPPLGTSVSDARRFVRDRLDATGHRAETREVVELLTSELVTNAVRHGACESVRLVIFAETSTERVRVEVADAKPESPVLRDGAPEDENGRGIALVALLSTAWGVEPNPAGKIVWFELGADPIRG